MVPFSLLRRLKMVKFQFQEHSSRMDFFVILTEKICFILINNTKMSKTVELQVSKSMLLINALKKKYADVKDKGVKMVDLEDMEIQLEKLQKASKEVEEMRARLSEKVKTTNAILGQIKQSYQSTKEIIRNNYPQERWQEFGVIDKR